MLKFRRNDFFLAIILFLIEVVIAIYAKDKIIRPYGGDFLVVIFLYYSIRSFVDIAYWKIALAVLLLAYVLEIAQYFKLAESLGVSKYPVAKLLIGSTFEFLDMLAYTAGIGGVLFVERYRKRKTKNTIPL